jgi:cation:H+ antiporter
MLDLLIWGGIFIISIFFLVKSSDYFTMAAEKIGFFLGLPAFIIGVTIVAFGTSLPELISSLFAVQKGYSEIVAANVIGSNITNIFLILGIAAIVGKKIKLDFELIRVDLPLLVGSAFLLYITIIDGIFTFPEAILFLGLISIYLLYTASTLKKEKVKKSHKIKKKKKPEIKPFIVLLISSVFIYFSANYTIESLLKISEILKIGTEIIAVGAVALGTSLPELAVSINAAKKGRSEIAVGNILGSNIFNTFAVMGIPALFGNLIITESIISFALPVMIMATLLYFFITQDKEINLWEGWLLLAFYVLFIGKLLNLM